MKHRDGHPVDTSTYTNWGCRCDGCKEAHRQAVSDKRAWRYARRVLFEGRWVCVDPHVEHGKVSTYENWGCRCVACTRAKRDRQRLTRVTLS